MQIYTKRGGGIAHGINGVDVHHRGNSGKEKRKVQCYDIPSAFVNTNVDEDILMVLRGELANMMVQIAPQVYRKLVTVDRKRMPILYVKLQKALYGLMRASLLL